MTQRSNGERPSPDGNDRMGRGIALALPIGVALGLAYGMLFDNLALGIALGAGCGVSIGIALGSARSQPGEGTARSVVWAFIALGIGLFVVALGALLFLARHLF